MAERRVLVNALNALKNFVKSEEDITFALYRISCASMPAANQPAVSNPRAFHFTLDVLIPLIKTGEDSDLAAKCISEMYKSFSSDIPQESDASQHVTTSHPSAKAELATPVESKEHQVSSATAAPSASAHKTTSPPSAEAASINSVAVHPSSTTPALPKDTQSQQSAASLAVPQSSSGASAQPQQPLYQADQLPDNPYVLIALWSPAVGARLPYEMAQLVGPYQDSSCAVLVLLIEHGGLNHSPALNKCHYGIPLVERNDYHDSCRTTRSMVVQRDYSNDTNGCPINIPYVTCHQYYDLYNSMIHIKQGKVVAVFRKLLAELKIAIEYRSAVHTWYEALPATDARVAFNPRHLNFLRVFTTLENHIERALETRVLKRI